MIQLKLSQPSPSYVSLARTISSKFSAVYANVPLFLFINLHNSFSLFNSHIPSHPIKK